MERKNLFSDLKKSINEVENKVGGVNESAIPIAARNLQELAERVTKSWNRAYGEFADARNGCYDVAATFNISTRVSHGPKEVKNITRDTEESLVNTIDWVADRFRKDYQNDVVKRGGDLRAHAKRLAEAAHRAKGLDDRDLIGEALNFVKEFLTFRTAVSDHLYRSVGAISRRAEELINRYLPPEKQPDRPPGGARGPRYKGEILNSPAEVASKAGDIIEHLDTFTRLSEPTIEEIEKMGHLADEVAETIPVQHAKPEPEPEMGHPTDEDDDAVGMPPKPRRKRVSEWLTLRWEQDPEIGTFI